MGIKEYYLLSIIMGVTVIPVALLPLAASPSKMQLIREVSYNYNDSDDQTIEKYIEITADIISQVDRTAISDLIEYTTDHDYFRSLERLIRNADSATISTLVEAGAEHKNIEALHHLISKLNDIEVFIIPLIIVEDKIIKQINNRIFIRAFQKGYEKGYNEGMKPIYMITKPISKITNSCLLAFRK